MERPSKVWSFGFDIQDPKLTKMKWSLTSTNCVSIFLYILEYFRTCTSVFKIEKHKF
jgi:hypothetical protein